MIWGGIAQVTHGFLLGIEFSLAPGAAGDMRGELFCLFRVQYTQGICRDRIEYFLVVFHHRIPRDILVLLKYTYKTPF